MAYDSHQDTCSYRFPWKPTRHATVLYAGRQHMQHEKKSNLFTLTPKICTTHPRCYVMQVVCVAHKRCVARYLEIPNKQTLICQINLFCKLMLQLRWGENDMLEVETWATRGGGERTSAGLWICCTTQYLTVLTVFSCFGQMTWNSNWLHLLGTMLKVEA